MVSPLSSLPTVGEDNHGEGRCHNTVRMMKNKTHVLNQKASPMVDGKYRYKLQVQYGMHERTQWLATAT